MHSKVSCNQYKGPGKQRVSMHWRKVTPRCEFVPWDQREGLERLSETKRRKDQRDYRGSQDPGVLGPCASKPTLAATCRELAASAAGRLRLLLLQGLLLFLAADLGRHASSDSRFLPFGFWALTTGCVSLGLASKWCQT